MLTFKTMKIYTKTGDTGKTSLVSGKRVEKFHLRIECYGTVDELNSALGIVCAHLPSNENEKDFILKIQNQLFNLGALLACDNLKIYQRLPKIFAADIEALEKRIDKYNETLPELKNFILPGGSAAAAFTHLARCICRRAERLTFALNKKQKVDKTNLIYLNRLSDFLFVFSRYLNSRQNIDEIQWKKD